MKKLCFSKILFLCLFFQATNTSALFLNYHQFRFRTFIYHHILNQVQGVSAEEFKNVTVVKETPTSLIFQYGGLEYRAIAQAKGSILVHMPEGKRDRVLWQTTLKALVLSTYRNEHN